MKKWLKILLWIFLGAGVITVFVFSNQQEKNKKIINPEISIHVEGENTFLTEKELWDRLKFLRLVFDGQQNNAINIHKIEKAIAQMTEVKNVLSNKSFDLISLNGSKRSLSLASIAFLIASLIILVKLISLHYHVRNYYCAIPISHLPPLKVQILKRILQNLEYFDLKIYFCEHRLVHFQNRQYPLHFLTY